MLSGKLSTFLPLVTAFRVSQVADLAEADCHLLEDALQVPGAPQAAQDGGAGRRPRPKRASCRG